MIEDMYISVGFILNYSEKSIILRVLAEYILNLDKRRYNVVQTPPLCRSRCKEINGYICDLEYGKYLSNCGGWKPLDDSKSPIST